jgi:hypothetical protein
MKISNISIVGVLFFLLIAISVVGVGALIAIPLYNQHKIEQQFPIGTSVQLRGLDIKGNVSQYVAGGGFTSENVQILVIDKFGHGQIITVNANLLTK